MNLLLEAYEEYFSVNIGRNLIMQEVERYRFKDSISLVSSTRRFFGTLRFWNQLVERYRVKDSISLVSSTVKTTTSKRWRGIVLKILYP